jgi:hypothetical protein
VPSGPANLQFAVGAELPAEAGSGTLKRAPRLSSENHCANR